MHPPDVEQNTSPPTIMAPVPRHQVQALWPAPLQQSHTAGVRFFYTNQEKGNDVSDEAGWCVRGSRTHAARGALSKHGARLFFASTAGPGKALQPFPSGSGAREGRPARNPLPGQGCPGAGSAARLAHTTLRSRHARPQRLPHRRMRAQGKDKRAALTLLPTLHSKSRRAACARAREGSTRHNSRDGSVSKLSSSSNERSAGVAAGMPRRSSRRRGGRATRRATGAGTRPPAPGRRPACAWEARRWWSREAAGASIFFVCVCVVNTKRL